MQTMNEQLSIGEPAPPSSQPEQREQAQQRGIVASVPLRGPLGELSGKTATAIALLLTIVLMTLVACGLAMLFNYLLSQH